MKKRILNEKLASLVASLRHGEMLFIADAGSGTSEKALYPLRKDVQYLDLETVTGVPSMQDIVSSIVETGDIEGGISTDVMKDVNKEDYDFLCKTLGKEHIREVNYIPEYYQLRDRCKAVIQTGDYKVHAQVILIAGYPSGELPFEWVEKGLKAIYEKQTD